MSAGDAKPARQRMAGQVLIALYAIFAVAAGARSAVQLSTRYDEAPVAYLLSALAALVYLVATIAFRLPGRTAFMVAVVACTFELAGVLFVGTFSLVRPEHFPDATVWSTFGIGYGFIPLLLPIAGLIWLRHVWETEQQTPPGARRR